MSDATKAKLLPLVHQAYWAAKTPCEESLVSVLMAMLDLCDPYWDRPLRGSAHG